MLYIGLICIFIITVIRAIKNKETLIDSCLFFILSLICFLIIECIAFTIHCAFMGDEAIYFFF